MVSTTTSSSSSPEHAPGPATKDEHSPAAWNASDGTLYEPKYCAFDVSLSTSDKLIMTDTQDNLYQFGWLFSFVIGVGITVMFFHFRMRWVQTMMSTASAITPEDAQSVVRAESALTAQLRSVALGEGRATYFLDLLVVSIAVVNVLLSACATEALFKPSSFSTSLNPDAFVAMHDFVELLSILAISVILYSRVLSAKVDPKFEAHEHSFVLWYLLSDVYSLLDVLAVVLSAGDFLWCRAVHINWIWLCGARALDIMARRGYGISFEGFFAKFESESRMLSSVLMLGGVVWVLVSGLYYISIQSSRLSKQETAWYSAEYNGEPWQRFSSIPSSMFFVLLNLTKKNPLAHMYSSFWTRALVTFVNILVVPMFALPTGILGSIFGRVVMSQLQEDELEESEQEEESGSLSERAPVRLRLFLEGRLGSESVWISQPTGNRGGDDEDEESDEHFRVYAPVVGTLGVVSVMAFFASTAPALEGSLFGHLAALIDGFVGSVFAAEWCLRVWFSRSFWSYALSPLGIVDFLSSWPGVIHVLVHFFLPATGLSTEEDVLCIFCVARLFKLERILHSFADMADVLSTYRQTLMSTSMVTLFVWMFASTILYWSEQENPDRSVRENHGSVARSMWAEAININGEWVWADYTWCGKGVLAAVAIFSVGVCVIPMTIFTSGYVAKIFKDTHIDDIVEEVQADKWQVTLRPVEEGRSRRAWSLLYAHYRRDVEPTMSFKLFRAASITLTMATTLICVIYTLEYFRDDNCKRLCCWFQRSFYLIDLIAFGFFLFEFRLRVAALGYHHLLSRQGFVGAVSLLAIFCCLIPSWRSTLLHPYRSDSEVEKGSNLGETAIAHFVIPMIIPMRLIRLFAVEEYFDANSVIMNVVSANKWPLARSCFSLVCVWFVHAALLHYLEKDSVATEEYGIPMPVNKTRPQAKFTQADRYANSFQALQYSLVHLTGDFPLTTYRLQSKVVLIIGTVMGMCTIAAFTGIFSSGLVNYLAETREEEIRKIAEARMEIAFRVVLKLQRQFRRNRAQTQEMEERMRVRRRGLEDSQELREGLMDVMQSPEKRQNFLERARHGARHLVAGDSRRSTIFLYLTRGAVIVNVINTLLDTCLNRDDRAWQHFTCEMVEVICVAVFAFVEFPVRLSVTGMTLARWYDLFCFVPGLVFITYFQIYRRVFLQDSRNVKDVMHSKRDTDSIDIETLVYMVYQVLNLSRVVRILSFARFQRETTVIMQALCDSATLLLLPAFLALHVWLTAANLFTWFENSWAGPARQEFTSIPATMYWTSWFLLGEWPLIDFSPLGSIVCVFCCLWGMMLFAIPLGIIVEGVQSALMRELVQQDIDSQIKGTSRNEATTAASTSSKPAAPPPSAPAAPTPTASQKAARHSQGSQPTLHRRLQAATKGLRLRQKKLTTELEEAKEAELLIRMRARREIIDRHGTHYEGGGAAPGVQVSVPESGIESL
jgi:hypothetical protein